VLPAGAVGVSPAGGSAGFFLEHPDKPQVKHAAAAITRKIFRIKKLLSLKVMLSQLAIYLNPLPPV
jgi:hypothetical protein